MTSSVYVYVTSSLLGLLLLTVFLDNIRPTSAPPAEQTQNYSYWQVIKVYYPHNVLCVISRSLHFTISSTVISASVQQREEICSHWREEVILLPTVKFHEIFASGRSFDEKQSISFLCNPDYDIFHLV